MAKYKIAWGDRSGDGHSMTADTYVEITSDHTLDDMRRAYATNTLRWGVKLTSIGEEYEESTLPVGLAEKMQADGVDVDKFCGEWNGEYYVENPAALAMAYFSTGIAGFEWKEVQDDKVSLIGDYSSVIETESYGYGFLSM